MRDELLYLYERELSYLRRTGAEFAGRYPKVASRLQLEPTKCDDPHVERLLEGFAFLAARIHLRLEDDFPELGESLLEVVYPQHTRPIPALSIAHLQLDREQGKLPKGLRVPSGSLLHSRPVGGAPCRFRTSYETTLWPVEVAATRWMAPYELEPPVRSTDAVAALRLELRCLPDLSFSQLEMETLRLHLHAEGNLAAALYELLCDDLQGILLRDPTPGSGREPILLPASALRPVGFEAEEALLPGPGRTFLGYGLLQEYFTLPEKFFFFDLSGFDRVRAAGFGPAVEVVFLVRSFERADRRPMLETGVTAETIRTGCVPIVNLFPQTSEPVLLNERVPEYLVVADAHRRDTTGIYSVEEVVAVSPGAAEPLRFEPFYSLRHARRGTAERFWAARRRPVAWRPEEGTDVYLSFLDLSGRTAHPEADAVTVRLLCHNGDLPSRLPFDDAHGDLELPGAAPVRRIRMLTRPTPLVQRPTGRGQLWRLVSQLSLNYVSLLAGEGEALRELLRLHNAADSEAGEKQIQGVLRVQGSPGYARVSGDHGLAFARGQRVEIEFDEERFTGGGAYLLGQVLHHFLGHAVSLNSFSMLTARSRQRRGPLGEWPPRSGWKTLL